MFNIGFLTPTIRATGAEGQQVMRHLTQKTRFLNTTYAAATLTMLSGLVLYWMQVGFSVGAMTSGRGMVLLIGGISGIIAWVLAMILVRGIFNRMQVIGKAIQAQGGPPTAEQGAAMQGLVIRLGKIGRVTLIFLVIALLAMSSARYVM